MKHEPTTKTLMVRSEDLKCCIVTGMGGTRFGTMRYRGSVGGQDGYIWMLGNY